MVAERFVRPRRGLWQLIAGRRLSGGLCRHGFVEELSMGTVTAPPRGKELPDQDENGADQPQGARAKNQTDLKAVIDPGRLKGRMSFASPANIPLIFKCHDAPVKRKKF